MTAALGPSTRPLPWRLILAAVAANAVILAGLVLLPAGSWAGHVWSDAMWLLTSLACAVACWVTSRRVSSRRERAAWRWWSAGASVWAAGMLLWTWYELVEGRRLPIGSLTDAFFIASPLFFVPAVWLMRTPTSAPGATPLAATELGLAASLIFVVLGATLYDEAVAFTGDPAHVRGAVARLSTYTLALLFGVIALSQRAVGLPPPVALLLLLGLASLAAVYTVFVLTLLVASYEVGRAFDVLWCIAFSLLLLAAVLRARDPAERHLDEVPRPGQLGWVWAGFFATLCAGVFTYWDAIEGQVRLLLLGVAALMLFSGLRWALLLRSEARARARLEDAVRAREDFIAVASHELRTPLTASTLQLQLLDKLATRSRDGVLPVGQLQPLVLGALRGNERLQRLIDVLLDMTRARDQRLVLHLREVSLSDLLAELVERHRAEFDEAGCVLHVDIQPDVVGRWDPLRLGQVVTNLFSNAMKFGSGREVDISLRATDEQAVLEVADHGIGVAHDDRAKIFERFERAVSVQRYGGLGLGLFVCNEIVRALGGTICVGGEPGRGATFTVYLPLRPPAA